MRLPGGGGFANINLRAYYAEGARRWALKSRSSLMAFPGSLVSPVGRGHSAAHLQGFHELRDRALSKVICRRFMLRSLLCIGAGHQCTGRVGFGAGEAEHGCQVFGHRQSGRRIPGGSRHEETGAAARCQRCRDSRRRPAPRPDRGDLHLEPAGGTTLAVATGLINGGDQVERVGGRL